MGETEKPASTNADATQRWSSENSTMTARLVNSMLAVIRKAYLSLPMTKDVCEAIKKLY